LNNINQFLLLQSRIDNKIFLKIFYILKKAYEQGNYGDKSKKTASIRIT